MTNEKSLSVYNARKMHVDIVRKQLAEKMTNVGFVAHRVNIFFFIFRFLVTYLLNTIELHPDKGIKGNIKDKPL